MSRLLSRLIHSRAASREVFPTEQDRLHGSLMRPYRLTPHLDRRRFVGRARMFPLSKSPSTIVSVRPSPRSSLAAALRQGVPVPLRRTERPVSSLARDAGSDLISADAVMGQT